MQQAAYKCETTPFKLKSSATFWVIKCSQRTKIQKVINLERSPKKTVSQIWPVKLLRDPSPPFHPPSQPHIMMAACPPHCPTPLLMTTLPPLHAYPTFATKFKWNAPISKLWVDKMGGSAACRQIRSKMSNGKDHSTTHHSHTPWW